MWVTRQELKQLARYKEIEQAINIGIFDSGACSITSDILPILENELDDIKILKPVYNFKVTNS